MRVVCRMPRSPCPHAVGVGAAVGISCADVWCAPGSRAGPAGKSPVAGTANSPPAADTGNTLSPGKGGLAGRAVWTAMHARGVHRMTAT